MFQKVYSATIHGIDGLLVQVEADVSPGLPSFDMVGILSSEVREARERVRTALKNSGFPIPPKRITVNLSPADRRKEGAGLDLPIAVAILAALGLIPDQILEKCLLYGELSLDGSIRPIHGALCIAAAARDNGFSHCLLPKVNALEGAVIEGVSVVGACSLTQVVEYFRHPEQMEIEPFNPKPTPKPRQMTVDFSDVNGQAALRRAAEVAAAGMHNILYIGPPGSGKTMIAKRIPTILPPMTYEESLEITKIYSVCGLLADGQPFLKERPFRSPHHTVTASALAGGGALPRPGEMTLAHHGVLFLDELPEFQKKAMETLRQPIEDGVVTISRLHGTIAYPAQFMLVGAMNACACGYYPARERCNCSENDIRRYLRKISRPLLDRIDITIEAKKIPYQDLKTKKQNETSAQIRKRVAKAQITQKKRFFGDSLCFNSQMTIRHIKRYCTLGKQEESFVQQVYSQMGLSARAYHRLLKVARTIADLDGQEKISLAHLSEAVFYRNMEEEIWGKEASYGQ